jgi:hypothetical protein
MHHLLKTAGTAAITVHSGSRHLGSDFRLAALRQCVSPENPGRYPLAITADDHLDEKLRQIGLKK